MLALIKINLKQVMRSRLLITLLLFTFLVQWIGVRLMNATTMYANGGIIRLDSKDMLFWSLVLQIFNGTFLAALYGIWFMPQAHIGQRNFLTYVIPVPKWMFPGSYAVTMLAMLFCQFAVGLVTSCSLIGWENLSTINWNGLALCLALQTLAFLVTAFGFAVFSMVLGQIPTFILGTFFLGFQQIAAVVSRLPVDSMVQSTGFTWFKRIYSVSPPMGELAFRLRENYVDAQWADPQFFLWFTWLFLFCLLFQLRLMWPTQTRGGEVA